MFSEPGATRLAALGACLWLLYFALFALQYFRAVALRHILRLGTAPSINGVALFSQ